MNWDAIGAISETLGALAVLVSLLYLASQIRSNTRQSRAAMASSITVEQSRLLESLGSRDLASVAMKVVGGDPLDPVEQFRWQTHLVRTAHVLAAIETAHRNGQLDDGFYVDCARQLGSFVSTMPGARQQLKSIVSANHPSVGESGIFGPLTDFDRT
jgi:hypothetical protein